MDIEGTRHRSGDRADPDCQLAETHATLEKNLPSDGPELSALYEDLCPLSKLVNKRPSKSEQIQHVPPLKVSPGSVAIFFSVANCDGTTLC